MNKPLREYTFRPINGVWQDQTGTGKTLAEILKLYELLIDDKCEFARFKDYQTDTEIWYRATALKITITIWQIH